MTITIRKTLFLISIAALAFLLAACKKQDIEQFIPNNTSQEESTQQSSQTETTEPSEGGITITATDTGFEPTEATVKLQETITWTNNSTKTVQVGSANHPTHTVNQEITGNKFVIALEPGESQTVTVNKSGTWGYHDHLKPSVTGTVAVE